MSISSRSRSIAACGFAAEAVIGLVWTVCAEASKRTAKATFFLLKIIAVVRFRCVQMHGIDCGQSVFKMFKSAPIVLQSC